MRVSFLLNLAIVRIVNDWPCIKFLGHRNNNSVQNREKNYNLSNFFCYSMFGQYNIIKSLAMHCLWFNLRFLVKIFFYIFWRIVIIKTPIFFISMNTVKINIHAKSNIIFIFLFLFILREDNWTICLYTLRV